MPIRIALGVVEVLRTHAARAYPDECCGALLSNNIDHGDIVRATELTNESTEPHGHRFLISPDVVRSVERAAEAETLNLVGFYHSHPDAPAVPSAYDDEHAVSWLLTVIVSSTAAGAGVPRAFEYDMNTCKLIERAFDITPADA